ncbi:MAG: hypothetical protein R6V75_07050 [Bacteroidales bacterium]
MMKTKDIEGIWKLGREPLPEPGAPDLELLRGKSRTTIRKNRLVTTFYLILFMALQGATIVLAILNLQGYRGNPHWMAIHAIICGLSVLFLGYGLFLMILLRRLARATADLTTTIRSQVRFNRVHYHAWLVLVALSCLMTTIAVTTFVDNENGHYQINNPTLFVGVLTVMTIFIYFAIRAANYPLHRELQVYLADLMAQTTEGSYRLAAKQKRRKWLVITGMLIMATLLVLLLILGIVKAGGL